MANLFQKLEIEAFRAGITPRTKQSMEWFRRKATQLGRVGKSIMDDEAVKLQTSMKDPVGNMYMFFYDPKHKETLPFYDRFPLAIIIGPAPQGFYGLNLHYLPPVLRAKFLDGLLDVTNNKKYDETTRFQLSYNMLQGAAKMKYFKPCFKHYLTKHVKSRLARVMAPEWEIATFLPTASWEKSNSNKVYKDSRSMI